MAHRHAARGLERLAIPARGLRPAECAEVEPQGDRLLSKPVALCIEAHLEPASLFQVRVVMQKKVN